MNDNAPAFSPRQLRALRKQMHYEVEGDFAGTIEKPRRFRHQDGVIARYKDGVYVRYTKIDESGERVKVAARICDLDADQLDIEYARKAHMKTVNASVHRSVEYAQGERDTKDITVGKFFDNHFSRYIFAVESGLRRSTADAYQRQWGTYCADYFADKSLSKFDAADGTTFLETLVKRNLRRSMIAKVKAICSSMFRYAVRMKKVTTNVWRDVEFKTQRGAKEPREYTVQERDAILKLPTLTEEAKTFFAFISVAGLRPSEAAGMKWERIDFKVKVMHITEGAAFGRLDQLKTEKSKRTLAITEPLLRHLKAFHTECKLPASGLLFKRKHGANTGAPIKTGEFSSYYLKSEVEAAGLEWKGLYAGRHLTHKAVWDATHDILKVTAVSGNTNMMAFTKYLRAGKAEAIDAQRAVEKRQNGSKRKRV